MLENYARTLLYVHGKTIDLKFSCLNEEMRNCRDWNVNYIYEPEIVHALCSFIRPGDICIDAGAADGYHSLLMSCLVGDAGEVVAFEPDLRCFGALKVNIDANHAENIHAVPIALSDENGVAVFFVCDEEKWLGYSSFVGYENVPHRRMNVLARRLDQLIDPCCSVRLAKIDCEGSEEKILHGAEGLLRRGVDYVLMEFNFDLMPFLGATTGAIRAYMTRLGYDFFVLFKDGRVPLYVPPYVALDFDPMPMLFNGMFAKHGMVSTWSPLLPKEEAHVGSS